MPFWGSPWKWQLPASRPAAACPEVVSTLIVVGSTVCCAFGILIDHCVVFTTFAMREWGPLWELLSSCLAVVKQPPGNFAATAWPDVVLVLIVVGRAVSLCFQGSERELNRSLCYIRDALMKASVGTTKQIHGSWPAAAWPETVSGSFAAASWPAWQLPSSFAATVWPDA